MDESIKIPDGYRFNPYEKELITCYLKRKVVGQKLPSSVVEEKKLYGPDANPWQVFDPENHPWILSEVTSGKFEKVTYAFVNLTRKATAEKKNKLSKDNYVKKAGCGTWDGQTKRHEITDCNGDVIGEKRLLVFEIDDDSDQDLSKVGYWKMHEYRLGGINEGISNPCNTVLCKITFDSSKKPQLKLRPKVNNRNPVQGTCKPQQKNTNVDSASSSTMNSATVDGNQGVSEDCEKANTTHTRPHNLVVPKSYRDKGKQGYSTPEIVELCDEVEYVDISDDEENVMVTTTSPSEQLNTGYSKPVPSDFCWPSMYNNDCEKIIKEGGRRELNFDKPKVHFPGYQNPNEDTNTVLGKRRSVDEILFALTKKVKPESSNICCPAEHDDDCQKTEKEAGAREKLISNFINFL